jgi:c(7)-type cytochrome triheme protein
MGRKLFIAVLVVAVFAVPTALSQFYKLPPLPEPSKYGAVLIERQTGETSFPTVSFSHWSHRTRYTCRVCHFELEFALQANATEITEQANLEGKFCGACHDGETAFGHTEEYCAHCHNYGKDGSRRRFADLENLPWAPFGNEIDWTRALEEGLINPKQSIVNEDYEPLQFTRKLDIPADWSLIPGAEFPHETHQKWLDCADCHPDIFNIKKKTTENFDMQYNLEGKFCGSCHLKVAFPLDDCSRCHPRMRR